jgi:hypothetical protein
MAWQNRAMCRDRDYVPDTGAQQPHGPYCTTVNSQIQGSTIPSDLVNWPSQSTVYFVTPMQGVVWDLWLDW